MKLLHTSDWHLGRTLYGKKRYNEFAAFLDWLAHTLEQEKVDALLVAGDVFDTSTPSNKAQTLYYQFLCRVSSTCCRHVVLIAGNHDSPTFLDAPKTLLKTLHVHVVGAITDNPADEVITLYNAKQQPEALVCAVPYLRDKDIRTVEAGESLDDKNTKLVAGVKQHYAQVCTVAEQIKAQFEQAGYSDIPIVGMGHLFAAGGRTVEGDGVRDLYVGSLAHVGNDVFPAAIDYLALGHLHVPQAVGGAAYIRYCGSPIPMGYGESTQKKLVVLVEFKGTSPTIQLLPVPCFQPLVRVVGAMTEIEVQLRQLKNENSRAWLEIEYTGKEIVSDLRDQLDALVSGSFMEIRRIKNRRVMEKAMRATVDSETLDDLSVTDVFTRFLDVHEVPVDERQGLMDSYHEVVQSLNEHDDNAE